MEFKAKIVNLCQQRCDLVIVGLFNNRLSAGAQQVNDACNGYLSKMNKTGDLGEQVGQTLLIQNIDQQFPRLTAKRILLVNCGDEKKFTANQYRNVIGKALQAAKNTAAKQVVCTLTELATVGKDFDWNLRQACLLVDACDYRFDQLKSDQKSTNKSSINKLFFPVEDRQTLSFSERTIKECQAINLGINLCKDLGNLPANICTPTYLAEQAKELSKQFKSIKTQIIDQAKMEKLGMDSLLSVAKGSHQPPKLIVMQYQGAKDPKQAPIALVGKGVTFDSGGISIKPSAGMDEMKYDMLGAASVFGSLNAIAELALPINVVGIIAATENLPGGSASKPGDVVTSLSGQTIEILNTDAEGRLILCDALTYCKRFKPKTVIDIATLTGAIVVALGHHYTGVFTKTDQLAKDLLDAGEQINDLAWRMPLDEAYGEELKSNFADMANIGGRWGGSSIAASFLAKFAEDLTWAHLDIAGSAWSSGANKGATGRCVSLLTQFLINQVKTKRATAK